MQPVESIEQYKAILQSNRLQFGKTDTNCCSMSSYFLPFIEDSRLLFEVYPSGLGVFIDEKQYYNLYYFLSPSLPFPEISLPRPVLIEEIFSSKSDSAAAQRLEQRILAAGFRLFKTNQQYELSLSDREALREAYAARRSSLSENDLTLRIADTTDMQRQSVALWESALDATDLPESHKHFIGSESSPVLCLLKQDRVIGTYWLGLQRAFAEGRHIVIHPDFKRRGLGTFLLLAGADYTIRQGKGKIITWISDNNLPSIAMHTAAGFQPIGRGSIQYIKE